MRNDKVRKKIIPQHFPRNFSIKIPLQTDKPVPDSEFPPKRRFSWKLSSFYLEFPPKGPFCGNSAEKFGNLSGGGNFVEKFITHEKDSVFIAVTADRRVML